MKHKHTPGPWVILNARNGYPYQVISESGRFVTRWASIARPSELETHANAALIASAPDLLEALEEALRKMEGDEMHNVGTTDQCHVIARTRAALQKALNTPKP